MSNVAKKVPHLTVKAGRFYFRMRVPQPLIPSFGAEVTQALGDVTKAQAEVRARELAAQHAATFLREKHRLGLAAQPPVPAPATSRTVTLSEAKALGQLAGRSMLAEDMEARIEGWNDTSAPSPEFGPGRALDDALKEAVSGRDLSGVKMQAEDWLGAHGLALPTDATETRRILMTWALELSKARKGQRGRDEGEPVDTPAPPQLPASLLPEAQRPVGNGQHMRDAFDTWKTSARRPDKTVKAFERHLSTFEAMSGNPLLSTLRRAEAVRFRDGLQQWAVDNGKTARTADNILTSIKALGNVARDREWMEGNPFERLAVTKGGKDSEGREPWTPDELVTLFDAPLFKSYELPAGDATATKAGADAAYWVPLLAAYTGARPSELCQLWTDDLSEEPGGLVVEFRNDSSRGQRLKDKKESKRGASWRAVPIHSELIRLGLRDYWQAVKERGEGVAGPLFPSLPRDGDNGAAGQFGQWFGEFKRGRGFDMATKTLHSFRHTVETELGFAGVSPTLVDAITGHAGQGIGRKVYGATIRRNAERLRQDMEKLQYSGVELPRVYGLSGE